MTTDYRPPSVFDMSDIDQRSMKMASVEEWDSLVSAVEADIPGFKVRYKDESWVHRLIDKVVWWRSYGETISAYYPTVWFPSEDWLSRNLPTESLQHEWVHLKDQRTFFGWSVPGLWVVNVLGYWLVYLFPQWLSLLALFVLWDPYWILAILFIPPLPAPGRAATEARAYQRTVELGIPGDRLLPLFRGSYHYYMWPWANHDDLVGPSPYKHEMDQV